ncbi:MAG: EAL domain-containing protein [Eubacteriales bacterium]
MEDYVIEEVTLVVVNDFNVMTDSSVLLVVWAFVGMALFWIIRKEATRRKQLLHTIEVDELTGFMTERKFIQECKKRIRNTFGQYTLISIDIDNFKYINEFYGFQVGSEMLKNFSDGIRSSYGEDDLMTRIHGDHFAVLTTTKDSSCTYCGKMSCDFCDLPNITTKLGENYNINISVGAYHIVDPTVDFAYMMDCANIARTVSKGMYGIVSTFYSDTMDKNAHIQYEIIRTMQQAIVDREFRVVYQPKVDLATGEVCGCEALVRWIKQDGSMVFPDNFIPVFEKNGFIVSLDYYMLDAVCRFIASKEGVTLPKISVNLSGITLLQEDLLERILEIIGKYHIAPKTIELEITESAIVDKFELVVKIIQELIHCGFTISMDDFGSGISSLNRLKDIQVHILKIDREFLSNTLEDRKGAIIIGNIVQMAHQLGIQTIAEGIENRDQLILLGDLGCDMGQGYYFAKPLSEEDYCGFLANYTGEENQVKDEMILDRELMKQIGNAGISSLIMDSVDNIIYIADVITYELYFISKETIKVLALTEEAQWKGKKCYEILQGRKEPCEFCTNHLLNSERFYRWEHYNEFMKRHYTIYNKILLLEDRQVRLEIATDMTERITLENNMVHQLKEQQVLNDCIELLHRSGNNASEAINELLCIVSNYYEAERGYIFLLTPNGRFLNNAYEWCADGIEPQIDVLQGIERSIVEHWFVKYEEQGEFYIDSLEEEVDSQSREYEILDSQGIVSLVTAPLKNEEGDYSGFMGVDNPKSHIKNTGLIRSISKFIDAFFDRNVLMQELNRLSYTDSLTGMENRYSYERKLKIITKQKVSTMGVAYYDINFLKRINDTQGHEGGDQAIISCANVMKEVFEEDAYRIGGDEFVILCPEMQEEEFLFKMEELKNLSNANQMAHASIGYVWSDEIHDVMKLIQEADRRMYIEKEKVHRGRK